MVRVCIDPGHGGHDSGARNGDLLEKSVVLSVGMKLDGMLTAAGLRSFMTRHTDSYLSLRDRVEVAKNVNADLFVSIHCNADPDPRKKANGSEIWIARKACKESVVAAHSISLFLMSFTRFRGIKRANFLVLRSTPMPAVLIELDFIDRSDSHKVLGNNLIRGSFAASIAGGVCLSYGERIT